MRLNRVERTAWVSIRPSATLQAWLRYTPPVNVIRLLRTLNRHLTKGKKNPP
jgi:hypothetical protein